MFRFLTAILAAFLLSPAAPAFSQDNPIAAARAAGLYGVTPDLSRQLGNDRARLGQQIAWEDYGLYFDKFDGKTFIAGLDPLGAAAQQGAKIGDIIRFKSLTSVYAPFALNAERPHEFRSITLNVLDGDSGWERSYALTPAAPGGQIVTIPPALRNAATAYPAFGALLRGDATQAPPVEVARTALLSLQAISNHPANCSGPNAVAVPVQITRTTTTRDGFGTFKGNDTSQSGAVLRVRPEFASWVRANISLYPTGGISTVRSAVVDLLSQEGCSGAGVKQLEASIAALMGVSLPDAPAPGQAGGIPADSAAFIASCYPATVQITRSQGQRLVNERSIAASCFCQEYAARAMGDTKLYQSLAIADYRYLMDNTAMRENWIATIAPCDRAPEGSALRQQIEALWREMNI
jgi:hypothetical protein